MEDLENDIVEVLKSIYDPEIPVDIFELGLIYEVKIDKECNVEIEMTLTSPNCPVAESMPKEVEDKVSENKETAVSSGVEVQEEIAAVTDGISDSDGELIISNNMGRFKHITYVRKIYRWSNSMS
mgnify:CR=1 FL=1